MFQKMTFLPLVGRILLSLHFLLAGINKFGSAESTAQYINSKLFAGDVLVWIVAIFEVVAAVMLIVGFKTRWAAAALAVFTLLAALIFHQFWAVPAEQAYAQTLFFWKNIGIAGGMIAVAYFGAGPLAIDKEEAGASAVKSGAAASG